VISKTPYDQYVGGFWPYINDCNTFTQRTINACQTPSLSASPLFNSKPVTVWDKVSLLPQADAVPKYRLIDVDLTKSMAIPPTRKLTVPKPK